MARRPTFTLDVPLAPAPTRLITHTYLLPDLAEHWVYATTRVDRDGGKIAHVRTVKDAGNTMFELTLTAERDTHTVLHAVYRVLK